ncbi:MAG: EcsC family protein [Sciscionella sp.]
MAPEQYSDDLPPYEARAWEDLQGWKQRHFAQGEREGGTWRQRLGRAGDVARRRLEALPGVEAFHGLFGEALRGLTDLGSRAATASVRRQSVLRAYRKRGHPVSSLEDIRRLDLRHIDDTKPRLDLGYIAASAVGGAGTGLAVSGGQLVAAGGTVATAGAGVAPGAATIVGAMAVDAAAVLFASHRVVAHIAAYYGYDAEAPAERLIALGVLGVGTANQRAKAAAYLELNRVVQGLARREAWQELSTSVLTAVVNQVYQVLGIRLTKRKLAQAIPVAGILIGAGLNARTLAQIADEADHLYRERFLRERYGLAPGGFAPGGFAPDTRPSPADEDTLRITDIIDAEIVEDEIVEDDGQ